jgi:hypothetical protein
MFSNNFLENVDESIILLMFSAGPSGSAVYGVGRSPAEIVGSNPTGGKDVGLL